MEIATAVAAAAVRSAFDALATRPSLRVWFAGAQRSHQEAQTVAGVDLSDPRISLVRGDILGFDVAGGDGPVRIRWDTNPPSFHLVWRVTRGPDHLAGNSYAELGEALRAALDGSPA